MCMCIVKAEILKSKNIKNVKNTFVTNLFVFFFFLFFRYFATYVAFLSSIKIFTRLHERWITNLI